MRVKTKKSVSSRGEYFASESDWLQPGKWSCYFEKKSCLSDRLKRAARWCKLQIFKVMCSMISNLLLIRISFIQIRVMNETSTASYRNIQDAWLIYEYFSLLFFRNWSWVGGIWNRFSIFGCIISVRQRITGDWKCKMIFLSTTWHRNENSVQNWWIACFSILILIWVSLDL